MEAVLLENFRIYLIHNNPELILMHGSGYSLPDYIAEKMNSVRPLMNQLIAEGHPDYLVSLICHSKLIEDLRPSKANYIRGILEAQFPQDTFRMKEYGVLTYGLVNLIALCNPLFQAYGFSKSNQENSDLKTEIITVIHDHLA